MIKFDCDFLPPAMLTEDIKDGDVLDDMIKEFAVPIMVLKEHDVIDSMKKQFPEAKFDRLMVVAKYERPYQA